MLAVSKISASNITINPPVSKILLNNRQQENNKSKAFKQNLPHRSAFSSLQTIKLLQAQVEKLKSDSDISEYDAATTSATNLLPFLLKEFQLSEKAKLQQKSQTNNTSLSPQTGNKQGKIQALNELIDDFDIDEDTDFMDLSRWVMNINNEMSIKD